MSNSNSSTSGGIGIVGMTFIVFLVLKLCKVIDWSWWWVTAPIWGSALMVILILVAGVIAVVIYKLCTRKNK
jgi:membrane protein YdbS with pleckstrin-like domain